MYFSVLVSFRRSLCVPAPTLERASRRSNKRAYDRGERTSVVRFKRAFIKFALFNFHRRRPSDAPLRNDIGT